MELEHTFAFKVWTSLFILGFTSNLRLHKAPKEDKFWLWETWLSCSYLQQVAIYELEFTQLTEGVERQSLNFGRSQQHINWTEQKWLNWTKREQTCNKSIQLHDAFIQRRYSVSTWLHGYSHVVKVVMCSRGGGLSLWGRDAQKYRFSVAHKNYISSSQPCVGHRDDESQAQSQYGLRFEFRAAKTCKITG